MLANIFVNAKYFLYHYELHQIVYSKIHVILMIISSLNKTDHIYLHWLLLINNNNNKIIGSLVDDNLRLLIQKHPDDFIFSFLLWDFRFLFIRRYVWLKQRQQEQKEKEEQLSSKEPNNPIEKSFSSSSGNSSNSSSITTNGADIPSSNIFTNFRKINANRSHSVTLRGQSLLPDKPSIIK